MRVNSGDLLLRKVRNQRRWYASFVHQRGWHYGNTPKEAIQKATAAFGAEWGRRANRNWGIVSPDPVPLPVLPMPAGVE